MLRMTIAIMGYRSISYFFHCKLICLANLVRMSHTRKMKMNQKGSTLFCLNRKKKFSKSFQSALPIFKLVHIHCAFTLINDQFSSTIQHFKRICSYMYLTRCSACKYITKNLLRRKLQKLTKEKQSKVHKNSSI